MPHGVTVWRGPRNHFRADKPARSGPVINYDLLPNLPAQFSHNDARRHIRPAPGGTRENVAQRPFGIRSGGGRRGNASHCEYSEYAARTRIVKMDHVAAFQKKRTVLH